MEDFVVWSDVPKTIHDVLVIFLLSFLLTMAGKMNQRLARKSVGKNKKISERREYNSDDESSSSVSSAAEEEEEELMEEADREDNSEQDSGEENSDEEGCVSGGFGDAMAKVLAQTVGENISAPILAKRTTSQMRSIAAAKLEQKQSKVTALQKKKKEEKDLVIPSFQSTYEKDRKLRKIATKGVVALFNAISKHQRSFGDMDDSSMKEKDKVKVKELSKENFLGLLKKSNAKTPSSGNTEEPTQAPQWKGLDSGFMMGAKMKDFDHSDEDNDEEEPAGVQDSSEEDEIMETKAPKTRHQANGQPKKRKRSMKQK